MNTNPQNDSSNPIEWSNLFLFIFPVVLIIVGLLYLAGSLWKHEEPPGGAQPEGSQKSASKDSVGQGFAASAGSFLGGMFAKKVSENPEAAASFVKSAAPSIGKSIFGGSGGSPEDLEKGSGSGKNSPKDSSGFYGESNQPKEDKKSMFTGGGLFGGPSTSSGADKAALYGVAAEDDSASNPFIS